MPPPRTLLVLPRRITAALFAMVLVPAMWAQVGHAEFNILKGEKVIGRIVALKDERPGRTLYAMTSLARVDVLLRKVVNTSMITEYSDGLLHACHTAVKVNGAVRDSSHLVRRDGNWHRYVHSSSSAPVDEPGGWTTARMYFEEPVAERAIYVESVLAHCPLTRTGEGRYTLVLPNQSRNHYVYDKGVLVQILVDRAMVDLVFRRV